MKNSVIKILFRLFIFLFHYGIELAVTIFSYTSYIYLCFILCNAFIDSDKCSIPAAEDDHHFSIPPLFPYAWTAYSSAELRHLVQGPYKRSLQGHREPLTPVSVYSAEGGGTGTGTGPSSAQRRLNSSFQYQDYQSKPHPVCNVRNEDDFYMDVKKQSRDIEIKSESDFSCTGVESSGSYKCIKCCKVGRHLPFRL